MSGGTEAGMTAPGRAGSSRVIGASALGTLFEWYDFFLYGALAGTFAAHFFAGVNETTAFLLALATFAVGFVVRPLGAILFGRLGDRVGRKVTFLATLALMGVSTFLVGLLPGHAAIGIAAPLLLVGLRIVQGLAIGGEFGGAIVYVAEHAPPGRRGLHASFIPAMAMAGLLLSLAGDRGDALRRCRPADFAAWGWRLPFLLSVVLLAISLWMRLSLHESPVFLRMQEERALSRAPVAEVFLVGANLRLVLAALFGCVIGQAALFYMGTFYAYYFLERIARVDGQAATVLTAVALAIGAPLVVACGWLADRVGRRPLLLAGRGARRRSSISRCSGRCSRPRIRRSLRRRSASPIVVHARPRRLFAAVRPARARAPRRAFLRRREGRARARRHRPRDRRARRARAGAARSGRERLSPRRMPRALAGPGRAEVGR